MPEDRDDAGAPPGRPPVDAEEGRPEQEDLDYDPFGKSPGGPPEDSAPWMDEGGLPPGVDDDEVEAPTWVRVLEEIGVYTAYVCGLLAVFGLSALAFEVQPHANIAIVSSLGGLSFAMVVATVAHTYTSENFIAGR